MPGGDPSDRPLVGTVNAQKAIVAERIDALHVHNHEGPAFPGWTRILFDERGDLLAALAGDSLGPRHVEACPRVPAVRDLVERLRLSGSAALVGPSGSGKSMVAWHAAFDLHREGWHVYLLTNPFAAAGEPPEAEPRALLVVDNVQSLQALPLSPALVGPRRAMLVVSTDDVAGFRGVVRIDPKRSVASLAAAFRERCDELLPLVQQLDPNVGEGFLDIRIERQIDSAARSSRLPWQFMFNLGSGHLRLKAKLAALHHAPPPLDGILFAVACYQLASRDSPCPLDWLETIAERFLATNAQHVQEMVKSINAEIPLVQTPLRVSTPHPRVAALILNSMFYGNDQAAQARRDILWSIFGDRSLPLGGVSWLLSELRDVPSVSGLPPNVISAVVDRAFSASDHSQSGFVLAQLSRTRGFDLSTIRDRRRDIASWIEHSTVEEAPGLQYLVNDLITNDPALATSLVEMVATESIAAKINAATPSNGYLVGALVDRLAYAATKVWLEGVAQLLDRGALKRSFSECRVEDVASGSPFVRMMYAFDPALSLELVRCISPAITGGLVADPLSGFAAAQDIFWWTLGFAPHFLRGAFEPDEKRKALAAQILTSVGPEPFSNRISRARRSDWDTIQHVVSLLREVVPELAPRIAAGISVEPLMDDLGKILQASLHEFDAVLFSLAFGEDYQPARKVVEALRPRMDRLTLKAVIIAPVVAAELVLAGGSIPLELGGRLPSWAAARAALMNLHGASPQAAKLVLQASRGDLSDGFAYRQANGGDGASKFLRVASAVDRETLLEAMRKLDVNLARDCWSKRAKGGSEERAVLREFLSLALEAGGPASNLATAIQGLTET